MKLEGIIYSSRSIYEGHFKISWSCGIAPLLCRGRLWLMPSCCGEGTVAVAWSTFI